MKYNSTFDTFSKLKKKKKKIFCNSATFREMPTETANQSAPSGKPEEPKEQKKQVSFHESVKKHDGLRGKTDMFNEYMRDVFRTAKRPQGQTTVGILARNLNVLCLVMLQKMLADLIWRCDRSRRGRATVLNKGGGCASSIKREHIPYLVSHVEHLETVIVEVRAVIARKENYFLARMKEFEEHHNRPLGGS